jgi:ribonuclease HII
VTDSKALSAGVREELFAALSSDTSVYVGIGVCAPDQIDRINILRATHSAMTDALLSLPRAADFALVDGLSFTGLPVPAEFVVKGDSRSASIAAASIVAKVHRDRLMDDYDRTYPGYGFCRNKGYGTAEHLAALAALGASPIHRRSFAPVRRVLNPDTAQLEFEFDGPDCKRPPFQEEPN